MLSAPIISTIYVFASILFILGLKGLTHPKTAVRGNLLGASAMLVAIVATLLNHEILSFEYIIAGIILGGLIGLGLSVKVKMTSMPQLVAAFNGFGGGASVLVAGAELSRSTLAPPSTGAMVAVALSGLIGTITFWGSAVAFLKLQSLLSESLARAIYSRFALLLLALVVVGLSVALVLRPELPSYYWAMVLVATILGVMLVAPVGGADMPVMVALLNSYSGLAAAMTGFVLSNTVLIIAGSLVGASGLILTRIMCNAMNRSLLNVLSGISPQSSSDSSDDIYAGKVTATAAEEVAMLLETATSVIIVPGYGMAVAQAQHAVRELTNVLETMGATVNFAIHPVAGRMPGHMNVLLADADIPYEKMKTMEEINSEFAQTDMVFVIGANDICNPLARTDPNSPIAGMPVLEVEKARTVVVIKRSLSAGYAGIPNPLFALENTLMLFGDGKKAVEELITALKEG